MALSPEAANALAAGVTGYVKGVSERDEVKLRKAQVEQQMTKLDYQKETSAVQTQIDVLNAQNQKLLADLGKQKTFSALDRYTADFDVKHLNNLIKNPMLADRFPDLVRIDKLDPVNDRILIEDSPQDIIPDDFDDRATKEGANGRFVKLTMQDGSNVVLDMMTIYAGTGYAKELDKQRLETLLKNSKLTKKTGGKDTAMVRNAEAVAAARENIKAAKAAGKEPSPRDISIVEFGTKEIAGSVPGKADVAEKTAGELEQAFGGRDEFFNADMDDRDNYLKAYPFVAKMEQLEGSEFTSTEIRELNAIRVLIGIGDPAKNLTDEETGLYDNAYFRVKKYLSDSVKGVAAVSAFSSFRNSLRNALFGSALTAAEIKAFNEAFGTLGNKLGPVLAQFKTALNQTKAKLDGIARMKNPYSAKLRLGIDQDKLNKIISGIDERLAYLEKYGQVGAPGTSGPPPIVEDTLPEGKAKRSLGAIPK